MKRKPKTVMVSLFLPVPLKKQINAIAGKEQESFSGFVRRACQLYLDGRPVYGGTPDEIEQTARLIRRYIIREARAMAQVEKAKEKKQKG